MSEILTLRDFAKLHGFTKAQALDLAQRGLILGAAQNPFSKQWRVEAPASLADWLEALDKPESDSPRAARSPRAGVMDAVHADTHPHRLGLAASLLSLADQQAPQGRAAGLGFDAEDGAVAPSEAAPPVSAYRRPEVQSCCRNIREAAQRAREVFSFTLTEDQRAAVAHALLEVATDLEEGDEAHYPEIREEVALLWAVREMLQQGRPT